MNMAQSFSIAAMGDIMLDREVGQHFFESPADFEFKEIRNVLSRYDIVLANLENPVGTRGNPHPKQDPHVAFRCHPDTLQVLKTLGINLVTLANNHLLDYGDSTLRDTLMHLDNTGISHIGGGENYQQANRPFLTEINGIKVAVLASIMIYSASTERATNKRPGVADHRIRKILKKIHKLKQDGYVVIVTIHWGIEYCFYPIPYQRQQARAMIDAGASAIIGHGPHFPQGIESYKHGQIVHSLGNFIFDEPYPNSKRSFIFGANIDNRGCLVKNDVYPVKLNGHIPEIDPDGNNSRTAYIVNNFVRSYDKKDNRFWKSINSRWFSDIAWRVTSMKSWKFVFLPPVSFYFNIGLGNMLKKLNMNNIAWAINIFSRKLLRR